MPEVADAGQDQRDVVPVADGDGFLVFNRAAGLNDRRNTRFGRGFRAIWEGEKGVGGEDAAFRKLTRLLDRQSNAADPVLLARTDAAKRAIPGNRNSV